MQERTFTIHIRANPYNNDRIRSGLQTFCNKTWEIPQWGACFVFQGVFTGTEEALQEHLRRTVSPEQDETHYWERPDKNYFMLKRNWQARDEERPWRGYGDISTTAWILKPDDPLPGDPITYFPEDGRDSYQNALFQVQEAFQPAWWMNDNYFHCECKERLFRWQG
jgi:hypothetical protein